MSATSEILKSSSPIRHHQVTRSISEVSPKVHKHHHPHIHRHKEDKSPQSAHPHSANPSLQPNGGYDTRSEVVTPVESRSGSRRGSTFHSATEKPEFWWPGRERVVKEGEIAEEKERGVLRATELRNSLMGLNTLSNNATRRLDNSYYSVLEKLSTLQNTISTLKELGSMTRALNSEFQHESEEISKEVDAQISGFSNFKSQETLISDLAKRVHTGRSKISALGARVEVIRERVEGWEIAEEAWQERTRRNLKFLWVIMSVVLTGFISLIVFRYTPQGIPNPGGKSGFDLKELEKVGQVEGGVNESWSLKKGVGERLLGVREGREREEELRLQEDPRLRLFDEL